MVKFRPGVIPNDPDKPRIYAQDFLTGDVQAPESVDYDDVPIFGMFGNDKYGSCVFAGNGHTVQQQTFYGQGKSATVTDDEVLKAYSRVTGFDRNRPSTDTGASIQDGLNDFRRVGLAGHKIAAFCELDRGNINQVKLCIAEFGSLAIGMAMPECAIRQHAKGEPWAVTNNDGQIEGGHRVTAFGYDSEYVYVATWASVQKMTWGFWNKYVRGWRFGEAWAQISQDWISSVTGKSPNGFDKEALAQKFTRLTGVKDPFAPPAPNFGQIVGRIIIGVLAAIAGWFGTSLWRDIGRVLRNTWISYPSIAAWIGNIGVCLAAKLGLDMSLESVLATGTVLGSLLTVFVHHSTIHLKKANAATPEDVTLKAARLVPKTRGKKHAEETL